MTSSTSNQPINILLEQAIAYHKSGKAREAIELYFQVLTAEPGNFRALYSMGILCRQMRRYEEALQFFKKAIAVQQNDFTAHFDCGMTLHELKRYDEALACYDTVLLLKPDLAEAHNNRGNILRELKRYDEALDSFNKAITLNAAFVLAYNNRGNVLRDLQRNNEALADFDRAIDLNAEFSEAYNNRGNVLKDMQRYEDALASYDKTLSLNPNYAMAFNNRGNILKLLRRYDDALQNYNKAIELAPDFSEAYFNSGALLNRLNRHEEALAKLERAIALNPSQSYVHGDRLHAQLSIGNWQDFESRVNELQQRLARNQAAALPFHLVAAPFSAHALKQAATLYAAAEYPAVAPPLWQGERYPHDRIRIGYFSADFHQHATAYLIAELFERHDRSRFEIYGYAFGPHSQDPLRQRLEKGVDHFFDLADHSSAAIAALARQHEIDIAIDLKGYTQDSRPDIFARRPAPIQVNYLGFPGTLGAPYIDYLIADPVLIPADHFQHYCEKIVQLPHSYQVNDRQRPIAASTPDRRRHGLPDTGFVYCCFNNNYKITPDLFALWMNLLSQVEGSVLWLLEANASIRHNLRHHAQHHGIAPDRLRFAPRMNLADHLARHRHADLFLDTFYCNAHTTASDALWAGLPVLTCLGTTFASRVAASLLTAIGLPELITRTHEHYHTLALKLATQPAALTALKQTLDHNRLTQPLFDTPLFTRHLEAAYLAMWQRQQQGLAAEHISIPA